MVVEAKAVDEPVVDDHAPLPVVQDIPLGKKIHVELTVPDRVWRYERTGEFLQSGRTYYIVATEAVIKAVVEGYLRVV